MSFDSDALSAALARAGAELAEEGYGPSPEPVMDEAALRRAVEESDRPQLKTISAADLQSKQIPRLTEYVSGLITQGLTILASPPKYGKSWLCLDMCLSVSCGKLFLGYRTRPCGCLYLALEDSERRLQTRMNKLLDGAAAPQNFSFCTVANTTDTGLIDQLAGFCTNRRDVGLIVVDTLQKVRGMNFGREGTYAADYRELGVLKSFADERGLALVLVHHLRKMADDSDPFNRISGTNGISGAADTMIVLTKAKRQDDTAVLSATGRDIDQIEVELRFDKDRCRWANLGDTEELAAERARAEYNDSPIVRTVKKLLEDSGVWIGTATALEDAAKYIVRRPLAGSPTQLGKAIDALSRRMMEYDGIVHTVRKNGNGGKLHRFEAPEKAEQIGF